MSHLVDHNDVAYAKQRYSNIVAWQPLLHDEDGRPQFNTTKLIKSDGTFISIFHVKPVYYEALGGFWRPLSEITEHHGNRRIVLNENWRMATPRFIDWLTKRQALFGQELLLPTMFGHLHMQELARPSLNIGLTTTTVYPDPDPETTTCDGYFDAGPNASWSTLRGLSASSGVNTSNTTNQILADNRGGGTPYYIGRFMVTFDTSSIGTDTISSSTFSGYEDLSFTVTDDDSTSADIVETSPASNTNFVTGDYDQFTFTSLGSINLASISTNAYNDFLLNDNTVIAKTGVTKLGTILGPDLNNSAPTGNNRLYWESAEGGTGTTQDPKLTVVHAAAGFAYSQAVIIA